MNILVICQHYAPEPFRIADICEELVKRGNQVTVVTGVPNYPMGEIYAGYENDQKSDELINGVRVHRCNIHPRKKGALHRVWNYYSYSCRSTKYIRSLDGSFDVVFIYQLSPVMMANAGIKYAKKHNKKSVLYCLDLWPASLSAGGISKGIVYKWFYRVSKKIYCAADKILITSKAFANYFEEQFGIKDAVYLPQYAEDVFSPDECKKKPDDYIDLMFAGNVGSAQGVDTIIEAASLCKDIPTLRWHIVGDGIELENCKSLAKQLDVKVNFHGRKPLEEMPKYYAMADAMLVTMRSDPIIGLTLPGKVQSYMAAGKPILGAVEGEARSTIEESGCGLCCDPDDAYALADKIRNFVESDRVGFGRNAFIYYHKNFTKNKFVDSLIEKL